MYFIRLILICTVLVNVKTDCDSVICLKNFVNGILNSKTNNSTEINVVSTQGDNVHEKLLDDILTDIQHEIKRTHNIAPESDTLKTINNVTKIYIKTFDIDGEVENFTFRTVPVNTSYIEEIYDNTTKETTEIKIKKEKVERDFKDNEIGRTDKFSDVYYDVEDDNATDYPIIDYVELYKDTTNEEVTYKPTEPPTSVILNNEIKRSGENIQHFIDYTLKLFNGTDEENIISSGTEDEDNSTYGQGSDIENVPNKCGGRGANTEISDIVYRWIGVIFIKNDTTSAFDYFCDVALLSEYAVITAARCVNFSQIEVRADNIIVVLGKRSLQLIGENEKVYKVKEVRTHDNFTSTNGDAKDDLAILILEERIEFNDHVQIACMDNSMELSKENAATTGWKVTGELTPIYFERQKSDSCDKFHSTNKFCATYGNDVTVCPSYGGLYFAKKTSGEWYLQGIRTGNTTARGLCFNNTINYTFLNNYTEWINENKDY